VTFLLSSRSEVVKLDVFNPGKKIPAASSSSESLSGGCLYVNPCTRSAQPEVVQLA
jgi:hypothetical protein